MTSTSKLNRSRSPINPGKLNRVYPINSLFGHDREQPIDRHYIEHFLPPVRTRYPWQRAGIRDDMYTRRSGGDRVTRRDILHAVEGNPSVTIVAGLALADDMPSATFDCILLTQTLQFIHDLPAAVDHLYHILKPEGVLLATFPGINQIFRYDMNRWGDFWYFTTLPAQRPFEEKFLAGNVEMQAYGNVPTAVALLHGLFVGDLKSNPLNTMTQTIRFCHRTHEKVKKRPFIQRIMDPCRLIQLIGRIGKKFKPQGLILLYHRVVTLDTDPQLLSVTPEHFAEHLEYLSEHYNLISLSELCDALKARKIPEKSVVLTFDDGYADNLWNAKPLLEKNDAPATVFVTSGYIGSNREFWWDELEKLLLLPERLPDQLELTISGKNRKWDLTGDVENITGQGSSTGSGSWNVTTASDPGPRYTVYRDLCQILNILPSEQQETILSAITQWAGVSRIGRATYRALTADELKQLAKGGLVEIGAHTVTHARLSTQMADVQKEEIVRSKESLEEILNHEVWSFSHPFGRKEDFNSNCVEIIKGAGFTAACTNYGLTLTRRADPYRLPRAMVRDWDVQTFAAKMKGWFDE